MNKRFGGMTYMKNGRQRIRVVGNNPQTTSQQNNRAGFGSLTKAWQGLTEEQRLAWESARTNTYYYVQDGFVGVSRPMQSGKDLFVAINKNLSLVADGPNTPASVQTDTPGDITNVDAISGVGVALGAAAGTLALTFTGEWTLEAGVLWATPPVSAGNMSEKSVSSEMRIVDAPIDGSSPTALGSQYIERFGSIASAAGQKVFWRLVGVTLGSGKQRLIASGYSVIGA